MTSLEMPSRNKVLSWDRRFANICLWGYSEAGPSEGKDKSWGGSAGCRLNLSLDEQVE